jgi:hypothetical protein
MKALVAAVSLVLSAAALHAGTAYDALNVIGKERNKAVLDRVIEVRGSKGAPTPKTWKVIVNDPEARGSIREFSVQGPKIAGERTPAEGSGGQTMNMGQLNLDSDGAHTVAERAAKKAGFAYDHVEYALRAGTSGGAPVWELRLVDERKGGVATVTVAADSGKLLTSEGLEQVGESPGSDERVAENRPPRDRGDREEKRRREDDHQAEERHDEDKPGNKLTRFADRAGRHIGGFFDRIGNKIAGTETPRRSTPPPAQPAPKPKTYRDANGTEFYRPRD